MFLILASSRKADEKPANEGEEKLDGSSVDFSGTSSDSECGNDGPALKLPGESQKEPWDSDSLISIF